MNKCTDEEIAIIVQMSKDGYRSSQIAKVVNRSHGTICLIQKKYGVSWKQLEQERYERSEPLVVEKYKQGENIKTLAAEFGYSPAMIKDMLVINGIQIRRRCDYQYEHGRNKFNKPLGYMFSDQDIEDTGKCMALHKAGWSPDKIADEMNSTPERVRECLDQLNKKSNC